MKTHEFGLKYGSEAKQGLRCHPFHLPEKAYYMKRSYKCCFKISELSTALPGTIENGVTPVQALPFQ